ncbi:MAG: T9SS type A sorting domain-containing protein [Bacteroidota bacterium]|nr:T9SS type A sorting domain-containing protein [Bacteroidota bacterium]
MNAQIIYQKQFHNSSEYISDFEIMNDTAIYYFGRHKDCNNCPHNTLVVKTDMLSNVQWSYKYGQELTAVDASRMSDGFVIFGSTTNDYFILKIDFEGNIQWIKRYATPMYEYMGRMLCRNDGNIIICGTSKTDFGANDSTYLNWLLLDAAGMMIESKFYQIDKRFSVSDFTIDANSGTILVGSIVEPGTQLSQGVLATIDSTGTLVYLNALYENNENTVFTNIITEQNSFYVAGFTFGIQNDPFIINFDTLNQVVWSVKLLRPFGTSAPTQLIKKYDSELVLIGGMGVIITDSIANYQSSYTYIPNFPSNATYLKTKETSDHGLLLAGNNTSGDDMFVVKIDSFFNGGCGQYPTTSFSSVPMALSSYTLSYTDTAFNMIASITVSRDTLTLNPYVWCETATNLEDLQIEDIIENISLFPNPAAEALNISGLKPQVHYQVSITDITGRRILSDLLSGSVDARLSLIHLLPGCYFIRLVSVQGDLDKIFKFFKK